MIEIKENIATITRDPLEFDITDIIEYMRHYIADYIESEYGDEAIESIDPTDYETLVNYIFEKAKIN